MAKFLSRALLAGLALSLAPVSRACGGGDESVKAADGAGADGPAGGADAPAAEDSTTDMTPVEVPDEEKPGAEISSDVVTDSTEATEATDAEADEKKKKDAEKKKAGERKHFYRFRGRKYYRGRKTWRFRRYLAKRRAFYRRQNAQKTGTSQDEEKTSAFDKKVNEAVKKALDEKAKKEAEDSWVS